MKQYIQLRITNFVPNIFLVTEGGPEKQMTLKSESILENLTDAAKKLGLKFNNNEPQGLYEEILTTALESDDLYMSDVIPVNEESIEFEIGKLFDYFLARAEEMEKEYSDVKMTAEARKEIDQNQSKDILASMLDALYLRLAAKTLVAASEVGIPEIHLKDDHKNGRLTERINKELDKMGVELIVD